MYNIGNCDFRNKTVLLRVDFNIPIKNSVVCCDFTRIVRSLPTIQYFIRSSAKVVIISHLGRPKIKDNSLSLKNIVEILSRLLNKEVKFVNDCVGKNVQKAVDKMRAGDVILLENLRFYKEEEQNDVNFAKELASLAEIYVNDAFSCSHRAHASILRITEFLPSYLGFLLQDEIKCLTNIISFEAKPITAIIGGSKILTKMNMLIKLAEKVDYLIFGGVIANNFLHFNRINIGKSLFQRGIDDFLDRVIKTANQNNCAVVVPEDVLVALNYDYSLGVLRNTESILSNDMILDIGPKTLSRISNILENSKTLLWNGPIGVFEHSAFSNGTFELMRIISNLTKDRKLTSVIGGGDSLSAISAAGFTDKDFTYVSTGGGAFLNWLSGYEMPGFFSFH